MKRTAFTLIELLIVVAIIAILAAIAVPNFLEAQTRAKISRGKADMRSIRVAVEAYCSDNGKYPPASVVSNMYYGYWVISTPIAYISNIPPDIYKASKKDYFIYGIQYDWARLPDKFEGDWAGYFAGWANPVNAHYQKQIKWMLWTPGPNLLYDYYDYPSYDPTNGTISRGEVFTFGP
ncbi:MAG: prepilin-type N-terminal cleavage/methylation domain-containing protein [bacterium]